MPTVPRFCDLQKAERLELWATLALRHCPGLGARTCKILVGKFGSAYEALCFKNSWKALGIKDKTVHVAVTEGWREEAKAEWDALGRCNPRVLLWRNECYPAYLREIPDSPLLLYGEGDFTLLASPCIAVIGSRNSSEHGRKVASYMARNLASCGICVVAGMARGIDSAAHKAALGEVGRTIGILGTGIDVCYPASNTGLFDAMQEQGLLVTEFMPGCKPLAKNFPVRNRLISGIALGVLVVEAAEKSGSLITAKHALEQNRDVYAVPGPAMNPHFAGCQRLVRDGAHAVFTTEDILRDLAPRLKTYGLDISTLTFPPMDENYEEEAQDKTNQCASQPFEDRGNSSVCVSKPSLPPEFQNVVDFLRQQGVCNIDILAEATGESVTRLNVLLMEMEIAGHLKRLPGAQYALVQK